jgi:hypothetical protein
MWLDCSTLRGGLTTWLVPRRYCPVPKTPELDPPIDGDTGTGRDCGKTSELLGLSIGAGATYGAGGSCADAIAAGIKTVASERQHTRVKDIERSSIDATCN